MEIFHYERVDVYMNLGRILNSDKGEESLLIEFFEVSKDAFFIFDKNFRITYINPQVESFLGTERKDVIGKVLWDAFTLGKEFAISEECYRAMYDRIPQFWEMFFKSINVWAKIGAYPLKNGGLLVNVRDITRRKYKELELEENEYLFRTLFEKIDEAFMIIELLYDEAGNINDHRFIKANDVFEKHTGLKNDKLIGKTAKQTFLKIDPLWLANYDEVNKTGKPKCFINFNKSTGCWYDVFCIPYGDNMIGVFFKDITEKVQAREALHKNEEKYKDFMMACFDSIYRASPDWKQINILKEEGTLADIPVLDSNSMKMYIHPDDRAYVANEINRAFLNKNIFDSEHRIFKEDGNIIWIRSRAVPIINEDGEVTEWFGAVNDITLEKEFELKLLEKEKEYLEIIDSSSLGSFIIDFEKKECYISETWKKRLGFKNLNNEEIYLESLKMFHLEDVDRFPVPRGDSANEKRHRYSVEYKVKTIDSGYIWVLGQSKILYNKEGKPIKAYGTHIDITDRKFAESALRKSKKQAQELIAKLRKANEHKNNFISALSHELRNPLSTITMTLSLIENMALGNKMDMYVGIIRRQTKQLMRLVDDLLEVTKIEKNKIELIKKDVDINAIVKGIEEDFKARFDKKGIILKGEYYADYIYINVDPIRIRQVIGNLLYNSLKFTKEGGVVRLTVFKDDDNKNVVIKVSDTGVGIAPEFLPYLFESFAQVDNSSVQSTGGLGLGLSIAKGIIDLHDGTIEAKSEGLGKGAEFIIKLPLVKSY